jgi:hypothetical protein
VGSASPRRLIAPAAAEVARKLRRVDTIVSNSVMIFSPRETVVSRIR